MRPRKYRRLTAARVRELLSYDPDTGIFTWKVTRKGRPYGYIPAGARAGSVWQGNGYRYIMLDGASYPETRLAYLLMIGCWPRRGLDHANRDRADNRWDNLDVASKRQQQGNTGVNKNNRLGIKGVCYEKDRKKYKATIEMHGKSVNLGRFNTAEEASAAYAAAAKKYFGKFART